MIEEECNFRKEEEWKESNQMRDALEEDSYKGTS